MSYVGPHGKIDGGLIASRRKSIVRWSMPGVNGVWFIDFSLKLIVIIRRREFYKCKSILFSE